MNISWETSDSILLANPTYSKEERNFFQSIVKKAAAFPGHIWVSTSGSTQQKWVGLSKQAFLLSAESVNRHLCSDSSDCWIHALPDFHVGGISIWARAYLSGAKICDYKQVLAGKWNPKEFLSYMQKMKGTLASLVPTQIYDLVSLGYAPPASLRAVIVGGGALLPHIYKQAVELGWPLLPSYGLTECASQVATAPLNSWKKGGSPHLELLEHWKARVIDDRLSFFGSSLLSSYAIVGKDKRIQFVDPKMDGWYISEDRGFIQGGFLEVYGRMDAKIKVSGENVDLTDLNRRLQTYLLESNQQIGAVLIAMPDERLGSSLHLVIESRWRREIFPFIQKFQQSVLPFERIRTVAIVADVPRSPFGKVLQEELKRMIAVSETFSMDALEK